jgi:hypothetical protein
VVLVLAVAAHAQVLTVSEIKDAGASRLQLRYMEALNAMGAEIQAHQFPYAFYFSRQLDIDEPQQRKVDQRSIRFDKFDGQTVLAITGNYYAAYSSTLLDKRARVKKTYEDVVLPILKSAVPRFPPDDAFTAFAVEVSYHVRRTVMTVNTENAENVTFVVPRAAAHHLVTAANEEQQQAALLDSQVYLDAEPFVLWLTNEPAEKVEAKPQRPAQVQIASLSAPAGLGPLPAPESTVSPALLRGGLPVRLITPATLAGLKAEHADTIARLRSNLDSQAHFVPYAPPMFIAFHEGAYLQLSVSSPLSSGKGSRYQLAALAFDDHIVHLIRPVVAYFPQDGGFDGVTFSTTLKLSDGDNSEAVEFFFPFKTLRCFASYDCTGQQLIDSGMVLINGERSSLNLEQAEAQAR